MPIPVVALDLDKPRNASFTLGAMCDFKEQTGADVTSLGGEMTPEQIRAFLWATLHVHDKEITLEEVGDLISIEELPGIIDKLMSLAAASSPEGGGEKN